MKPWIILLMLLPVLVRGAATNDPARIARGENWHSSSRLERIARDYAKQQKIDFTFEKTCRNVSFVERGTNAVATIWFSSGIGNPVLGVEIAPSGRVITNYLGLAVCAQGKKP